jgi:hypothetical protein
LDLATSGKGGVGPYIGICAIVASFGVAEAKVQGGMIGDLSFMHPALIQSILHSLVCMKKERRENNKRIVLIVMLLTQHFHKFMQWKVVIGFRLSSPLTPLDFLAFTI